MNKLYHLSVTTGIAYDAVGDLSLGLKAGEKVAVQCERYQEIATIAHACPAEPFDDVAALEEKLLPKNKGRQIAGKHLPVILHRATAEELRKVQENAQRMDDVHRRATERIQAHNLPMKLIHEHFTVDRKLLLLHFTAENRVDFRELLRDLSTLFHCRIEMRQVGVRDETSIVGGLGACGRPFCCSTFLHSISSVNVKTAKQQGLSLNPQSISGCCGRLKCCLQFEAGYCHHGEEGVKTASDADFTQQPIRQEKSSDVPSAGRTGRVKGRPFRPSPANARTPRREPTGSSKPQNAPKFSNSPNTRPQE